MENSGDGAADPELFERFIERPAGWEPDGLNCTANGVLVAGRDLIRGLDNFSPRDWLTSHGGGGFDRELPAVHTTLWVDRVGDYWYVRRSEYSEYDRVLILAVAFENVPICTHTAYDAMRLADHCYPVPRAPMPGCWVEIWSDRSACKDLMTSMRDTWWSPPPGLSPWSVTRCQGHTISHRTWVQAPSEQLP